MEYALEQFIDQAIQLELNAADIYLTFSDAIPEDANFWATLAWEEKNHASVLKAGKDILVPADQFPTDLLPNVIQTLVETNSWLDSLKAKFAEVKPDRKTAFEIAIKIESSAGEQHFQSIMEAPSESNVIRILQELCEDDIYHLNRIHEYMKRDISLEEKSGSKTKNILIVINDSSLAKLLKTILEPEGHIDIAENGRAGLQKVKDKDYELIISAIEMPIVDGIKFFNEAKGISSNLNKKFLFFSSEPSKELLSFFRDEDIRYLTKPSTINEIREAALGILSGNQ